MPAEHERRPIVSQTLLLIALLGAALSSLGCNQDPFGDRIVDTQEVFELIDDDITCVFQWTLNTTFSDGDIAYSQPYEEKITLGVDYFFALESDTPQRAYTTDDSGSTITEFQVISRSNDRIVLVYNYVLGVELITIWKKYGTAIWTKHRDGVFGGGPMGTLANGRCVD